MLLFPSSFLQGLILVFLLIQVNESKRTTEVGNNGIYKTGEFVNIMFVFMSIALVGITIYLNFGRFHLHVRSKNHQKQNSEPWINCWWNKVHLC